MKKIKVSMVVLTVLAFCSDYADNSTGGHKSSDLGYDRKRAQKQAQIAFVPVRANAQNKGWWDCDWRFVTVQKNKVAAEATVEYKSVTMNRNSKSVYSNSLSILFRVGTNSVSGVFLLLFSLLYDIL